MADLNVNNAPVLQAVSTIDPSETNPVVPPADTTAPPRTTSAATVLDAVRSEVRERLTGNRAALVEVERQIAFLESGTGAQSAIEHWRIEGATIRGNAAALTAIANIMEGVHYERR